MMRRRIGTSFGLTGLLFGDAFQIDLKSGGMYLIARFRRLGDQIRDTDLARRAQQAGL